MKGIALGHEHPSSHGTFSDGSLARRLAQLIMDMESQALACGYVKAGTPRVVIVSARCGGAAPHLHAGFLTVPVDVEVP